MTATQVLEKVEPFKRKSGIFTTVSRMFTYEGQKHHLFLEWRKSDVLCVLKAFSPERKLYDGPLEKMPLFITHIIIAGTFDR